MATRSTQPRTQGQTARKPQNRQPQRRNSSTSTRTKSQSKPQSKKNTSGVADYFHAFSKTKFFAPVLTIVIIFVGVLLDVLFAWNNYDRFFLILGIELVVVAIAWIILLLVNLSSEVIND